MIDPTVVITASSQLVVLLIVIRQNQGVIIDKLKEVKIEIENAHRRMDAQDVKISRQDERIDTLYDLTNNALQSWQKNASHLGQQKHSEETGDGR